LSLEISFFSRHKYKILAIALSAIVIGSVTGTALWIYTQQTTKTTLYVYHAGSLAEPYGQFASWYTTINPQYAIYNAGFGSSVAISQCTVLGKPTDVIGSADFSLIVSEMMEIPNPEYPGENFTEWYIITSKNSMALAYVAENSPPNVANLIDQSIPWYEILSWTNVTFGRADPAQDPCGYRTLMVWGLADDYYSGILGGDWAADNINASLWAKDPVNPSNPSTTGYIGSGATVSANFEVELITYLEGGTIDYLFIYESVARQHGLDYYSFNDYLDLSNKSKGNFYANVTIQRWSTMQLGIYKGTTTAKAIVYGLTIPKHPEHYDAAVAYVKFMLSTPGVWFDNYQEVVWPYLTNNVNLLPEPLRVFCINDTDYPYP